MMGHRERLINGDEFDALTRGGRRVCPFGRGRLKFIKRKFNKRARQAERRVIGKEMKE
jgi:hypothetical protein